MTKAQQLLMLAAAVTIAACGATCGYKVGWNECMGTAPAKAVDTQPTTPCIHLDKTIESLPVGGKDWCIQTNQTSRLSRTNDKTLIFQESGNGTMRLITSDSKIEVTDVSKLFDDSSKGQAERDKKMQPAH